MTPHEVLVAIYGLLDEYMQDIKANNIALAQFKIAQINILVGSYVSDWCAKNKEEEDKKGGVLQ